MAPPPPASWLASRVFVLTLPRAQERQRRLLAWGEASGIAASRFVMGIDLTAAGSAFQPPPEAEILTLRRHGVPCLQSQEYGCLLSHRHIHAELLRQQLPWALVLEDDALPTRPDWPEVLTALLERVLASSLRELPWVLHLAISEHSRATLALRPLGWKRPHPPRGISPGEIPPGGGELPALGQLDLELGSLWTTLAYVISQRAAANLQRDDALLAYTADDWEMRMRAGSIQPMLASCEPLFRPDPALASQIPAHSLPAPVAQVRRGRRKLKTLLYRAGLAGVHY